MGNRYVVIHTVSGRQEAEILKSYLEANGVKCEFSQEAAGNVYGFSLGRLGKAELLVPEEQAEEARELIAAFQTSDGEVLEDWDEEDWEEENIEGE